MTIEVRPAEKWEGSDCAVCVLVFDYTDRLVPVDNLKVKP